MAFGILPKFSSIPAANDVEMNWGLPNANRSINNIGTTGSEFSDLLKLLSAEPLLFGARKKVWVDLPNVSTARWLYEDE